MQDFATPRSSADLSAPAAPIHREIPQAYLILTNESVDTWCAAITSTKKLMGRKKYCDIVIPPKFVSVSREHAWIWGDSFSINIRDKGSTAGTRINGVEIGKGKEAKLVVGDRLTLGTLELQVVDNLPIQRQLFAETGVLIDESMDSVDPAQLSPTPPRTLLAKLTNAEFAIVLWIGRGYFKDDDIAKMLHRSPNTIRTQVNSIFRKLNIHSRTELVNLIRNPQTEIIGDQGDTAVKPGEE